MWRSCIISKNNNIRILNQIKYDRVFSSVQVPSNLILADSNIFTPISNSLVDKYNYDYPIMNVPKSIPILNLYKDNNNDNNNNDIKESLLEKCIFEVAIRKDIVHDVIRYIRHMRRQPKKTKRIGEKEGINKKT